MTAKLARLFVHLTLVASTCWLYALDSGPQSALRTLDNIRAYRRQHAVTILHIFSDLLSIPNVASDTDAGHATIARNAEYIIRLFQSRGVTTQILHIPGGSPAIYGELHTPGATKTVMFYAHYDGQQVNPSLWTTPPFSPSLRNHSLENKGETVDLGSLDSGAMPNTDDWRMYARSASDDKAAILGFLVALDALRWADVRPSVNLKFFLDGEEEQGSRHLSSTIDTYKDLLRADLWLICDGPTHQSGQYQLVYGARGITDLEMTIFGPNRTLHSGHYGNWAPNPAVELAHILASMRDTEGRIKIKTFYKDVLPVTKSENRALALMPDIDSKLRQEFALGRSEGQGASLSRQIMLPALNIRGIRAGDVGADAPNAIMSEASASIDFRLVPNQRPERVRALVEAHLRKHGYFVVHDVPSISERLSHTRLICLKWDDGYPAAKTNLALAQGNIVAKTIALVTGSVIQVPMLGGSAPLYLFTEKLKQSVLVVPIANYDNNQHAADENIRLTHLWNGIDIFAMLFCADF
jgi:acetylornithine deacetylase/succinyl-diaminopimelate desuccinylase-like protein